MTILFYLLCGHALADYPLQGDFLARGKNHKNPIPGVPWYQCLIAHALIQGGVVAAITGMPWLGLAEAVSHAAIDYGKSNGQLSFNQDQALHVLCKVLWAVIVVSQ